MKQRETEYAILLTGALLLRVHNMHRSVPMQCTKVYVMGATSACQAVSSGVHKDPKTELSILAKGAFV